MPEPQLAGRTAVVTGASRGFGRGIATALSQASAQVIGVARDRAALEEVRAELGEAFTAVPADATDPVTAGQLIDTYRPAILVLNAGATPLPRCPAAPLPGGYAGAKAAIRWLTAYAAEESARANLGIRFVSLLPQLTPATALGATFATACATRYAADSQAATRYAADGQATPAPAVPVLTPDQAGQAVLDLLAADAPSQDAYLLTAAGLRPLPSSAQCPAQPSAQLSPVPR